MSDSAWWQTLAERASRPPLRPRQALRIGAAVVGSLEPELAQQLAAAGLLGIDAVIAGDADAALAGIARWLHANGHTARWRDELLAVTDGSGAVRARIERSAVRPLGIATHAVHLIAFTPRGEAWVQQRSLDKATDPGLWDTLVGGLVAAGESDADALERETWEEAGLRVHDLRELRRSDGMTVRRPVREGYMVEHIEVYEAVVPEGLVPVNQDGEVARFERLAPEALWQRLAADEFTLEAALMLAAGLERRGALRSS
jgi:8-oxo-dGTP pyrophosphatase MutT (NUDIX family)